MTTDAAEIVRALLDLSRAAPNGKELLREVSELLRREVSGEGGTLEVTLVTPSGNESALEAAVGAMLKQKYNRTILITQKANPTLIGGAVLQIGDEQIDLSVRGALGDLEAKLRSSHVA